MEHAERAEFTEVHETREELKKTNYLYKII